MHDPYTLIWHIRLFGRSVATVWHIDSETDGSDDSCGWFRPRLTEAQLTKLKKLARTEYEFWLSPKYRDSITGRIPFSAPEILAWTWGCVAHELHGRRFNSLNHEELVECIMLAANPYDNLRSVIADAYSDMWETERLLILVARCYLRYHRQWWQHPKWHVHHWSIDIHFISKIKRWLFTRCDHCHKRFGWNETLVGNWGGEKLWHQGCYHELVNEVSVTDKS